MVSALQRASPSQCFQNRAAPVVPKALRLPRRAQKSINPALSGTAVSMRGNSRPSETSRITFSDKAKTFSQYRLSLLRTGFFLPAPQTSPLPLRELFHQPLQFLVILNRPTHPLFPLFGNVELTRLTIMALNQIKGDVRLSTRAAAALLATRLVSHREGPSQQPAGVR